MTKWMKERIEYLAERAVEDFGEYDIETACVEAISDKIIENISADEDELTDDEIGDMFALADSVVQKALDERAELLKEWESDRQELEFYWRSTRGVA